MATIHSPQCQGRSLPVGELALAIPDFTHKSRLTAKRRAAIEECIERLIAILDTLDPDCDLEPETDFCLAGDDGCGAFWRDGELYWGRD